MYLTVRDLKTGNRAEFVNKSDIINYINEKVFEGRDENYMVLEAYAGKYSIWLSNKEAAQGKVLRVSIRFKIADWNSPIRSDLWVERVGAGGNFISSETP